MTSARVRPCIVGRKITLWAPPHSELEPPEWTQTPDAPLALTSGSIYSGDHINQAGPVHLRGSKLRLDYTFDDVEVVDYRHHPAIKAPVAV